MTAGGPDPHMKICGWLIKDAEAQAKFRMAGCYVGVYNVPTAELLWNWDSLNFQRLQDNWRGIATRRERRTVRTPSKLYRFFKEYDEWMTTALPVLFEQKAGYEAWWDSILGVTYMGRYVAFKILEFFRRYCGIDWLEMPDIRPRGGWSPRATLALFYPADAEALNGKDSKENIKTVNAVADITHKRLADEGQSMDLYNMEVLLCDYRQSWEGQRQYPGRSHDSELDYYEKLRSYWGESYQTRMLEARQVLFPDQCLGELQGWNGVRKELGTVLRQHNYTWSDLKFDYSNTADLAVPVRRDN